MLDATQELIDFLKIKSGSLEIKEETYKVSNILNETFSRLHNDLKTTKTELIYDVSMDVSSTLRGDSKRMEQILSTLLHDAVQGTKQNVITLKLSLKNNKLSIDISNKNKIILKDELDALLNNYALKEEYKSQDKLYMYIAHQVILQMQGSLSISSSKDKGTLYHIELPYNVSKIENHSINKKHDYEGKRVFLCLDNENLENVLAEKYCHYKMHVDIFEAKQLATFVPNMLNYDVCILDNSVLNYRLTAKLEVLESSKGARVFVLKSIYDDIAPEGQVQPYDLVYKPLQNDQMIDIVM